MGLRKVDGMKDTKVCITLQKWIACLMSIIFILGSVFMSPGQGIQGHAAVNDEETEIETTANSAIQAIDKYKDDKVNLRFVFTTDLHGTVSSMDLIAGTDFSNAGLSRAINLIRKTRAELTAENVFTFDIGDVLLDASTEYIYSQDPEVVQPIYQAMALVGYDAITLGNHDFDYGKDYILQQLNGSGLMDKVVVSNLMNSKDDSYPFLRNMIIEREAVTDQGNKVTVRVGVIGETIPTLSTKTENYAGIWKTEDIVANVTKESRLLKEQGADIVVVLAHSGFGTQEHTEFANDASYQLTKIDDVDVVLCGHEHNEYPSTDTDGKHYQLAGVDKSTGLVNGKVIVMAKNNAQSIGVADLTLGYNNDGKLEIERQQGSVRRVRDYELTEDQDILDCLSDWNDELEAYRKNDLIELAEGVTVQNYLGVLEDTVAMQLQNDARIAYARRYIETLNRSYSGYPVIAAASHISYGANGIDDYVNISGSISYSDLFTLQNYRHMTYLYEVTGAQLKEWLELSASIYTDFTDSKGSTQQLIEPDWMNNWANFFVFDGIDYTISPYVKPRYNAKGVKINNTNRIIKLTYNGVAVTDDMVFVVAANALPTSVPVFSWAKEQQIRGAYRTQVLIAEFLQGVKKLGAYSPVPDYNWRVNFKDNQKFTLATSIMGKEFITKHAWFEKTIFENDEYGYYLFRINKTKNKEINPYVVIAPSILDPIMVGYDIYVDAFSDSQIKTLKYSSKPLEIDSYEWMMARDIKDHTFTAHFNSTYYIYAQDIHGNKRIFTVVVDNIGLKDMAKPKVWSVNNKKVSVTGRAEAGATVVVEIGEKEYTGRVSSNGNFSVSIPSQNAGTHLWVYVKDEKNDRMSEKVKILVKRNGPNVLSVNKYFNNEKAITGITNDEDVFVFAVADTYRKVYVPNNGAIDILLESNEISFENYTLIQVDEIIDEDNNFELFVPDIEV